jgi:hypothetical protein
MRSFIIFYPRQILLGTQFKEDKQIVACGSDGREIKCIEDFGEENIIERDQFWTLRCNGITI